MQRAAGFCSFKCLGIYQKYKRLRKQIPLARGSWYLFYNIDNSKKEQIGVSIAGLTSYRHKSKKYMVLQSCVPDSYRPQLFCLHNS